MENNKKGINIKLIAIIAAVVAVIIAAFFGIKALIPEKTPTNNKATGSTPEVITLPGEDTTDVTAITGTAKDKKGITDKEGHKIYDTGYKDKNGRIIYTTGKKDSKGNVLYTLNRTNDVGKLIYYTGKVVGDKLEITKTNAIPDYTTDKNSTLTDGLRYTKSQTIKYEGSKDETVAKGITNKWMSYVSGSNEELFNKVIAVDKGYVAVGNSNSKDGTFSKAKSSWNSFYAFVSKIGTDGKIQWTYLTGGDGMVLFYDVAELKDGSIVAVGSTCATDTDAPRTGISSASLIIKLDKNGKLLWSYAFPCNEEENGDMAYSVAATPDGGFVVGGEADSTTGLFKNADGAYKAYIFKFDKKGSIEWKKILSGSRSNRITALDVNKKGEIFACCVTNSFDGNFASLAEYKVTNNNPNTVILKLNKKGDFIWSANLAGWGRSEFSAIAATEDGGCVTGGTMSIIKRANGSFEHCYGLTDGYVVRYSEDGQVYWAHNIGGTEADKIEDVAITEKGIVVTGTTKSDNYTFSGVIKAGERDGFVTLLNNSGDIMFSNIIGGKLDDTINSIAPRENGFVLAGFTTSSDGVFKDSKANKLAQAFVASYDFSDEK